MTRSGFITVARNMSEDAPAARPRLTLIRLPADVLQRVAEVMPTREYATFAQLCTACSAAASGALQVVVATEVAKRMGVGEKVGDGICQKCPDLVLPDSVTQIGDGVFQGCSSLTSVVLPAALGSVGDWAFAGCTSLTSAVLPALLTSIGSGAFCNCKNLNSIALPASLTKIGFNAFERCEALTAITIPDSVVSIKRATFLNCTALAFVSLPANLTTVEQRAFINCTALKSITMPGRRVIDIQRDAFFRCVALGAPHRECIRAICPGAVF